MLPFVFIMKYITLKIITINNPRPMTPNPITEEAKEEAKESPNTFRKTVKLLSLPASLAAGSFYAYAMIRNLSYNNLRNKGVFNDIRQENVAAVSTLLPSSGPYKNIVEEVEIINRASSAKIDTRIAEMGFNSVSKRFKLLHNNQRVETMLGAFTAAGVALGVMLTIADHKNIFGIFSNSKDKPDIQK